MTQQPTIALSTDEALILQQISETGEEDVASLSELLRMQRKKVLALLERLRRKGLISIQRTASDWWVQISSKGKDLTRYVWPETAPLYGF